MSRQNSQFDDRAQAFTLEGLAGALILLSALLLAVQSVLITPTTGGAVDPEVRTEFQQQSNDILDIAAREQYHNDSWVSLDELVRYWSQSELTFAGAQNPTVGYGYETPPPPLGPMLEETFEERGHRYNIQLRYRGRTMSDGTKTIPVVERGKPSDGSIVATETVVLYDNQTLTAPGSSSVELWQYDTNATANPVPNKSGYYPIPNAVDGPIYNVVEVRLIVW